MWNFEVYRALFFIGNLAWVIIIVGGVYILRPVACRIGVVIAGLVGMLGLTLGGLAVIPVAWSETFGGDHRGYLPEQWSLGAILLVNAVFAALLFWAADGFLKAKRDGA